MKKKILAIAIGLMMTSITVQASEWTCPDCNNASEGNFCSNCGVEKPEWTCPECGEDMMENSCTNCGVSQYGVAVGDTISFGHYEQDNDTGNGAEEIEWEVLDIQEGKALLVSKYALDTQCYNTENEEVTWETCSLRSWLNGDFYLAAFDATEQEKIEKKTVHTEDNREYAAPGGNDTQDNVFLLSLEEIEKLYGVDAYDEDYTKHENLNVKATEYAIANGAFTITEEQIKDFPSNYSSSDEGICRWWLRSPGLDGSAAFVHFGGAVYFVGGYVNFADVCVRPALWIDLSA